MNHNTTPHPEVLENLIKVAMRMDAQIELTHGSATIGQFKLKDGRVCYFLPSSIDINPVGAATLVRDKSTASCVMSRMGYKTVEGKTFALLGADVRKRSNVIDRAYVYAIHLGLPVITKPNSSSRGRGVTLAHSKKEFYEAMEDVFTYDKIALVQRRAIGRDYRVVVLDGNVITACERQPLSVTGDGQSTVKTLLRRKQLVFEQRGQPLRINLRNPNIKKVLKRRKMTLASVPSDKEIVVLMDTANLMSGGEAKDVTTILYPSIARTAVNLTRDMGLRLSSVDLIVDGDISEQNPFVILEINSAPGLDHFLDAHTTNARPVEDLYFDVMTSFFRQ